MLNAWIELLFCFISILPTAYFTYCLFSLCSVIQLVVIHLPKALISPKWRKCRADGSWFQQKEKNNPENEAWHLHNLSSGSDLSVLSSGKRHEHAPQLVKDAWLCSISSQVQLEWVDWSGVMLTSFYSFAFFFFSCSGSSSGCLNKAEFAQIPEDGLNAACCIRCHALPCITWMFVATCLDSDLLCVSNMWIKWYRGRSMRPPDEPGQRRWIRVAFNEISAQVHKILSIQTDEGFSCIYTWLVNLTSCSSVVRASTRLFLDRFDKYERRIWALEAS